MALTKWDAAWAAVRAFIRNTYNEKDGFGYSCFNERFIVNDGWFGNGETDALQALEHCRRSVKPQHRTLLYDAIPMAIQEFVERGAEPSRPWVLIILTDGMDTHSKLTATSVGEIIGHGFNSPNDNFVFVIGVGHDANMSALRTMAQVGGFVPLYVRDMEQVQMAFALIALQVVTGRELSSTLLHSGNATAMWTEVRRCVRLHRQPIDVMVLMDASGSMTEPA